MTREIHENVRKGVKFGIPDLEKFFDELEKDWEKQIIKLFAEVGIHGVVKSDKYSLPYKDEVVVTMQRESYINGMYEFSKFSRPVIKKMLEENAYKVRFYIHAETYDKKVDVPIFKGYIGTGFKYSFRYYLH